ncbi:GNAT family N-acetyltransferase [Paenibacillus sp. ACRRX]|uniref:GNAT family N-acetyltransferase n=1 Tax=Paenibacillus sp. ACRRX TaxID=2918206 RepID=UPI001EF6099C|nr:GNAT family N-acetyltransferase [Paenibacillus sp. ACRRX]MCG7409777.1 GNAT family N-acetyltransferase [Paenibacillus sp. ACRRX]
MIKSLDLKEQVTLEALWMMQLTAYRIEANLIGFDKIPPLMESMEQLAQANEKFYGWYTDDHVLAGAVSTEMEAPGELQICRLMVRPDHFRQGIARKLMDHVLNMDGIHTFTISTGLKNEPAVTLYEKLGFQYKCDDEVGPGVVLRTLEMKVPSFM